MPLILDLFPEIAPIPTMNAKITPVVVSEACIVLKTKSTISSGARGPFPKALWEKCYRCPFHSAVLMCHFTKPATQTRQETAGTRDTAVVLVIFDILRERSLFHPAGF